MFGKVKETSSPWYVRMVGNGNIQINDMTSWVEPTMDHGDFDFKTS
jgi:hypothetical protein